MGAFLVLRYLSSGKLVIICRVNPANKLLFCRLILQIRNYLPKFIWRSINQNVSGFEAGGNQCFLNSKILRLIKSNQKILYLCWLKTLKFWPLRAHISTPLCQPSGRGCFFQGTCSVKVQPLTEVKPLTEMELICRDCGLNIKNLMRFRYLKI